MTPPAAPPRSAWRYGLPGLPLAFAALPLYVHLPHHYATLGVPLGALGGVLLLARVFDALTDPLLGRWLDGVYRRGAEAVWRWAWVAALVLWVGMLALLFPPAGVSGALPAWALGGLVVTTLAYSALAIAHQSWGARLGGDAPTQARLVAWREGWTLAGVITASVLPAVAGWSVTLAVLAVALPLALFAWGRGPHPTAVANAPATSTPATSAPATPVSATPLIPSDLRLPWRRPAFRRLMAVFVLSGLASAIPATLVLFFIADRLQAPQWEALFLSIYFLAAAAGMPMWLAAVRRVGLARAWLLGMGLSIAMFVWAAGLDAGDTVAYALVCGLSGLALGADLALPAALLAGVIDETGDRGRHEGAYFGWWNLAAKGNLALAAGLALPVLALLGYTPGTRDTAGLQALTVAYAVLPCFFKALAAALLWHGFVRRRPAMPLTQPIAESIVPPR
ncbi:MFS transporter [Tepidimonas taiwanensis]|uniref:Putative symporter YjmB n=1 Tax=Tepidimonas taiwanensis TaxID=307486 RepID=A0A554X4C1_9BURK|nr:MFS transporter [Tepidimonas taiwanensis]MCX7692727.1 MFS transporter [Tepidimonas taiwanensis]MDM7463794.1 MFS transporter [Tepidimonas taiwanensis]TSE30687.1 putative symporter YjmB [Tepidimonas taiwanensis]UBQ06014.1 MFS transporter [Tepidimonas taiwanensis]